MQINNSVANKLFLFCVRFNYAHLQHFFWWLWLVCFSFVLIKNARRIASVRAARVHTAIFN